VLRVQITLWNVIQIQLFFIFASTIEDSAAEAICFQVVCAAGRPSVNAYFAWCDISVLNGGMSMKLGTNIQHVSGHCWKVFKVRGQGHDRIECYNDGVTSRRTCLRLVVLVLALLFLGHSKSLCDDDDDDDDMLRSCKCIAWTVDALDRVGYKMFTRPTLTWTNEVHILSYN